MTTPLVPADVDLQDFQYMPLDVRRLRDSDLASLESPEACWAAVLLWSASWHQVPAASLPDDDRVLANLAGYGRVVKEWQRVREGALRGWIKCSDGRLYHPVVAEKALEAWEGKLRQRWKTECARIKKNNDRHGTKHKFPEYEDWVLSFRTMGHVVVVPEDKTDCPEGHHQYVPEDKADCPSTVPRETASKGEGEGKGYIKPTTQSVSCTQPPPTRKGEVCGLLRKAGMADAAPHYLPDEVWEQILGKRTNEEIVELAKAKMAARPNQRTGLKYIAPALLEDPLPVAASPQRRTIHDEREAVSMALTGRKPSHERPNANAEPRDITGESVRVA